MRREFCWTQATPFSFAQGYDSRDFLEALDSFGPDFVIADYNLPGFDGLAAVKLVRERDPELPILLVTGYVGDEAAVEVVKAGATDYVRKDRLARLPIAVKAALSAAVIRSRLNAAEQLERIISNDLRNVLDVPMPRSLF